jgi:hypothetical protein
MHCASLDEGVSSGGGAHDSRVKGPAGTLCAALLACCQLSALFAHHTPSPIATPIPTVITHQRDTS